MFEMPTTCTVQYHSFLWHSATLINLSWQPLFSLAIITHYCIWHDCTHDYVSQWHIFIQVISGHTGWVRSVTVEPGNKWFATGSGDRTIKVNNTISPDVTHFINDQRCLQRWWLILSHKELVKNHRHRLAISQEKLKICIHNEHQNHDGNMYLSPCAAFAVLETNIIA